MLSFHCWKRDTLLVNIEVVITNDYSSKCYTQCNQDIFQCCCFATCTMMTSSNGNIFRVTVPLCGYSPLTGENPSQRPVTRGFDVVFDMRLYKRLSKQSKRWWFETPSRSLLRHCNDWYVKYAVSWIIQAHREASLKFLLKHLHECHSGTNASWIPFMIKRCWWYQSFLCRNWSQRNDSTSEWRNS